MTSTLTKHKPLPSIGESFVLIARSITHRHELARVAAAGATIVITNTGRHSSWELRPVRMHAGALECVRVA